MSKIYLDRLKARRSQKEEAEVAAAETLRAQKAADDEARKGHRIKQAAIELASVRKDIQGLESRIALTPPLILHYRFDSTTRKRMKEMLVRFDELEAFQAVGFNRGLMKFGSPWFTLVSLIASVALAYQWMQTNVGLDGVGGSEVLTMVVTAALAFVLDLVAFMLLSGVLVGVRNFLSMEKHVAMLGKVMIFASGVGVVGFGFLLVQRFMGVTL